MHEIAGAVGILNKRIYNILQHFNIKKLPVRCCLDCTQLTKNERSCRGISRLFCNYFCGIHSFSRYSVSVDEKWINYYKPEIKEKSIQCVVSEESTTKKMKIVPAIGLSLLFIGFLN